MEKIQITDKHLEDIRSKYNCSAMEDDAVIEAMLMYEEKYGGKSANVLDVLCFPNFQSILDFVKSK